jgi:hypothetical protein
MNLTTPQRCGILGLLALVMAVTRINHFAPLPDASWVVFFLAGFYLRGSLRLAFPLLLGEAVLIDWLVITSHGLGFWQHYCMSPAYWFLLPAYLALWLGGSWLRARYRGLDPATFGRLVAGFVVAFSIAYLLSNGSFYWLGDSVPLPRSFAKWFGNLGDWYLPYLRTSTIYLAVAVVLHVIGVQFARGLAHAGDAASRKA